MSAPTIVGTFVCECCCDGRLREFTDENCRPGYMRCAGCECTRTRMGSATEIVLRIQVIGSLSIGGLEQAADLARALGADDDLPMRQDNGVHFFEVSGQGAMTALEIVKIRHQGKQGR